MDSRGFAYARKKTNADGSIIWRCVKRSRTLTCNSTIKEVASVFSGPNKPHVHGPTASADLVYKIRKEVREQAIARPGESAAKIAAEAVRKFHDPTRSPPDLPQIESMANCANRHRKSKVPDGCKKSVF